MLKIYKEFLLEKLKTEKEISYSILFNELKKVKFPNEYYEVKRKLGLNISLGYWVKDKIEKSLNMK